MYIIVLIKNIYINRDLILIRARGYVTIIIVINNVIFNNVNINIQIMLHLTKLHTDVSHRHTR